MTPTDAKAYTCGLCGPPNPGGLGGWGFTIRDSTTTELLVEGQGRVAAGPEVTNNAVEYVAVGMALRAYRETRRTGPLVLCSSSQLVAYQMTGLWPAKKGAYLEALQAVRTLLSACNFDVRWHWVPMAQNVWASELARSAMSESDGETRRQ